jgi:hypothetical protein
MTLGEMFSHGTHIVKAQLSLAKLDGSRGESTDFIYKEIAINLDSSTPIIWVGDYEDTYYEYDTILLPFRVYDPTTEGDEISVSLFRNGVEIDGSPRTVKRLSDTWDYWEITNLSAEDEEYFTIRVGKNEYETNRILEFTVLKDPRNMKAVDGAFLDFNSKGRSNSENKASRETLTISGKSVKANFNNFNWYNNGWVFDDNQSTCLRISNGASISIPLGIEKMVFQSGGTQTDSHALEIEFKVKNVQNYSKLITTYTRYKNDDLNWTDTEAFEAFLNQKNDTDGYTNYDAYLT